MFTVSSYEQRIIIDKSEDEYGTLNLRGGSWRWRSKKHQGVYPLNEENIQILFRSRKTHGDRVVWKPSFVEEATTYYKKRITTETNSNFLRGLKFETISSLPLVTPQINGNPPPFKNQHVSQYWNKMTDSHAYLWEMGTGKTRGAIEGWMIKKAKGEITHGLVVCPVSMLDKWVVEIKQWSDTKSAVALKGTRDEKLATLKEDWDWYCVTYETLAILIDEFLERVDEKWFVVLDEFTKIKNPTAKRSKACIKLGEVTKHKAMLSGTPVTQHAYDVFAPFLFLDQGETFGLRYDDFIDKYFWKQGYKLLSKRGSLEAISEKMYHTATRFLKKDCVDIPDKVYDQRFLEMPPYMKQKYDEMVTWAITQIEQSEKVVATVILTQLLRLSQITSGYVVDVMGNAVDFPDNPKIDALRDIFEESNGSKIIVWARFVHDVEAIAKLCKQMDIKYVLLHGEVKPDDRTKNVASFQTDPTVKVIIGTAGTGGHGIDLTAANLVVYYSNSYSLEQRLQSEDRAHRAGQVNKVTYIDLLMNQSIDVAIYKILRQKKNVADIVTKDNLRTLLGG